MPKITVNEQDISWYYRPREAGPIIVYMPGLATFGPKEPTLVTKETFSRYFGTEPADPSDTSYLTAASFVESGFGVLFHRVIPEGATKAFVNYKGVTFTAKYEGTYGNTLQLKINKALDEENKNVTLYVNVYDDKMRLLERATFNLFDPNSSSYYEVTNISTKFIELVMDKATYEIMAEGAESDSPADIHKLSGGLNVTKDAKIIEKAKAEITATGFFDEVNDPYQYWFDAVVDGGLNDLTMTEKTDRDTGKSTGVFSAPTKLSVVDKGLSKLCADRGNAIYFVDGHKDMTADQYYDYCGLFDSSYTTAFGPWGYAQYIANGVTVMLPGSYATIVRWAQSCAAGNPAWMAPAGVKRAQLGSFYKAPKYIIDKNTLDSWQNQEYIEEGDYKVNPIMKLKQYGYCVYGNSTLLKNQVDGSTSMLQSFSVRVLSNFIKSHAFDISLSLQFDQITDDLFAQFKTLMGVFMDQLKYQGALYDYNLVIDRSTMTDADLNNKNVPVKIQISPNPAAENFTINLEISQAGISFNDDTDETEIA